MRMFWISPAVATLLLTCYQNGVAAQPIWPASTDDLEDIMFLNSGYRARGFGAKVIPCSIGLGPGRNTAGEWLRTAFHDMATGNTYTGEGGMDGSIAFELTSGENIGNTFASTMNTYEPFFSSRTSLADVIAAGVYAATRSCGGPIVPIRGGRVDAIAAGGLGVPQPENAIGTFKNQYLRFGYSTTEEMIQFTACGHTIGGVHAANFPLILDAGTVLDDYAHLDSTVSTFDSKIASEYIAGTSKDPLVIGKSVQWKRNSDHVVFSSDGNVTIKALQDPQTFSDVCKAMFQKMVEIVPKGVTLSDPVTTYEIKPYSLQLTLLEGGSKIKFTGDIRIRTTERSVARIQLAYKDRVGSAASTFIDTTLSGVASGFDDTFSFFGFSMELPTDQSISSFNVIVTLAGGRTETFDNNGNGFKVDDTIMFQSSQSCLDSSGKLIVVAAVRDSASTPNLQVVVRKPRASPNPIPSLLTATAPMASQSAVGSYQLYSADYTISESLAQSVEFGVFAGSASDNYKDVSALPTACKPLGSSTPTPTSTPSSTAFAYQGCYTDSGLPRALAAAGYTGDQMAVETCATFCSNYQLFGLEYSKECYCGNTLDPLSTIAALSDCNMPCSGSLDEMCGAASRLSLYENLKYSPPVNPQIRGYNYSGCYTDSAEARVLQDSFNFDNQMTIEKCATYCNGSKYFGTEYGGECYCGATFANPSTKVEESDCSFVCSGTNKEFCGAANRLSVWQSTDMGK